MAGLRVRRLGSAASVTPMATNAPAVASIDPMLLPVRGSDLALMVTASTAAVAPGCATTPCTTTGVDADVGDVADDAAVVADGDVVVAPGSLTVSVVQEHAVVEMVVVVVAILADAVHGLAMVVAIGVVVTSLPSLATVVLTNRSYATVCVTASRPKYVFEPEKVMVLAGPAG